MYFVDNFFIRLKGLSCFRFLRIIFVFEGRFTSAGDFQLLSKFKSEDPDAFLQRGADVYFVIEKKSGNSTKGALLSKFPVQVKIS